MLLKDQTKQTLRSALITILARLKIGPSCHVRVDNQSALASLRKDKSLEPYGINLCLGDPKNVNKNAVVDKGIRELREQLVRLAPSGGKVSEHILAIATAYLNDLVRHTGRSARELWVSIDVISGENIILNDGKLSDKQFNKRLSNHALSAKYHSRGAETKENLPLSPGMPVYVKSDRSKSKARDQFVILSIDHETNYAVIQKFPMQKFRSHPISVKVSNIYPALPADNFSDHIPIQTNSRSASRQHPLSDISSSDSETDDDEPEESTDEQTTPPTPPTINAENDEASIHEPLVLYQPKYGDADYLKVGETIVVVYKDFWSKAVLLHHAPKSKHFSNGSLLWTYSDLNGKNKRSSYLFPGESWGVLRGEDLDIDVASTEFILPTLI